MSRLVRRPCRARPSKWHGDSRWRSPERPLWQPSVRGPVAGDSVAAGHCNRSRTVRRAQATVDRGSPNSLRAASSQRQGGERLYVRSWTRNDHPVSKRGNDRNRQDRSMAPADHVASCRADQNTVGRIEVQAFRLSRPSSGEGEAGKASVWKKPPKRRQIKSCLRSCGEAGAPPKRRCIRIFDDFRSDLLDCLEATDAGSHGNRAARARFRAKEARRHRHVAAI
jgi:hypothetical protein